MIELDYQIMQLTQLVEQSLNIDQHHQWTLEGKQVQKRRFDSIGWSQTWSLKIEFFGFFRKPVWDQPFCCLPRWLSNLFKVRCFLYLGFLLFLIRTIQLEQFKQIILLATVGHLMEKLVIWQSNLVSLFTYHTWQSNTFQKIFRHLERFNLLQEKYQVGFQNATSFLIGQNHFSSGIIKCWWSSRIPTRKIRLWYQWFVCSNVPNRKTNSLSHSIYSVQVRLQSDSRHTRPLL